MLRSLTGTLGITAVKMCVIIITTAMWMLTLGTARQVVKKKKRSPDLPASSVASQPVFLQRCVSA